MYTNKEQFFKVANKYIERSTAIIKDKEESIGEKSQVLYGADDLDISKLRSMISRCQQTFAKTMPWCPHEYFVRGKCALTEKEFIYFVNMQRNYGQVEHWGKYLHPYLYIDNYKYWTMGDPVDKTIIINRAKVEQG